MNESSSCRRSALCVGSFGLACGVLWAGAILIIGIVAMHVQYGQPFVEAVGHLYVGYALTVKGVIIGTIWAFFDAFIGGVIFAWLYNGFTRICPGKCCRS